MKALMQTLLRAVVQALVRVWRPLVSPRMVYGPRSGCGMRQPHSRISSHTRIDAPAKLVLGDHVFIGHFNHIDASGGLHIGTGCQITNFCSVLTHSSHLAIRLERERLFGHTAPAGMRNAPTALGEWSFIGPHTTIVAGTRIGRGVMVKAYSFVSGEIPDFAIVEGQPARVVGDTRALDRAWIERHAATYGEPARAAYEAWVQDPTGSAGKGLS
jgi:acetyltransferase-like isoleucine patch superfamily enzyme